MTGGEELMDRDGTMAGRGHSDESALDILTGHPCLSLPPPKSTRREMFGEATNVPAATGAAHETLFGNITPGKNYLSIA